MDFILAGAAGLPYEWSQMTQVPCRGDIEVFQGRRRERTYTRDVVRSFQCCPVHVPTVVCCIYSIQRSKTQSRADR